MSKDIHQSQIYLQYKNKITINGLELKHIS